MEVILPPTIPTPRGPFDIPRGGSGNHKVHRSPRKPTPTPSYGFILQGVNHVRDVQNAPTPAAFPPFSTTTTAATTANYSISISTPHIPALLLLPLLLLHAPIQLPSKEARVVVVGARTRDCTDLPWVKFSVPQVHGLKENPPTP